MSSVVLEKFEKCLILLWEKCTSPDGKLKIKKRIEEINPVFESKKGPVSFCHDEGVFSGLIR